MYSTESQKSVESSAMVIQVLSLLSIVSYSFRRQNDMSSETCDLPSSSTEGEMYE